MAAVFQDLVVYVLAYQDVETSQTAALVAKLQENGATISKRFSERVSHVVVQRTHAPREPDKAEGDSRLRDIFQRMEQVCVHMGWLPGLPGVWSAPQATPNPSLLPAVCCAGPRALNPQSREVVHVVNVAWVHKCLEQGRHMQVGASSSAPRYTALRPNCTCCSLHLHI